MSKPGSGREDPDNGSYYMVEIDYPACDIFTTSGRKGNSAISSLKNCLASNNYFARLSFCGSFLARVYPPCIHVSLEASKNGYRQEDALGAST
ncbi:hypothetical protein [Methylorubrum thiocyanatum]